MNTKRKSLNFDDKYRVARSSSGLRIPASACGSNHTGKAVASGPSKPNEATAEAIIPGAVTERIPAVTEERLYALAKSADELAEKLVALQT